MCIRELINSRQTCPGIALAVFAFLHVANGDIVLVATNYMNKRQDINDLIQQGVHDCMPLSWSNVVLKSECSTQQARKQENTVCS